MGRLLILIGLAFVVLGVVVLVLNRLNIPLGRLPGDVVWRGKNSTLYFPWVTCLILSALASLLLWLLNRRP
jgi:DUF2905 family protein